MTLQEAHKLFENLIAETTEKSEIKVYEKFVHILSVLMTRKFTKNEMESIEMELEGLNFNSNPENKNKYFKKALSKFEYFLKDAFSLTLKGYYTQIGIGLGLSFGVLFGIVFLSSFERSLGIALGLSIGMLFGLIIGRSQDAKAKREGRII